jgi:hypothetical protein
MNAPAHRTIQPLALGLALLACLLAALLRVFPLEWNVALVGALALFAGARLRSWLAYALPLVVMVATDALLAQTRGYAFPYAGMPFVYGSFLVYVLLGRTLARNENPLRIGATTVSGSLQFYIVTNLGVWLTSVLIHPGDPHSYSPTLAGLIDCYVQAIPFLARTVGSDALFTATLFGAHALLARWYFHDERVPGPVSLEPGE